MAAFRMVSIGSPGADLARVRAQLAELARAGTSFAPLMRDIGAALEASTQLRFVDQASPAGIPWAPLSPATIAARALRTMGNRTARSRRAAAGGHVSAQILLDTGRMRAAVGYSSGAKHATVGLIAGAAQGDNLPQLGIIGAVHQFGTNRAGRGHKTRIPARPWLGLSAADVDAIGALVSNYLASRLPGA